METDQYLAASSVATVAKDRNCRQHSENNYQLWTIQRRDYSYTGCIDCQFLCSQGIRLYIGDGSPSNFSRVIPLETTGS